MNINAEKMIAEKMKYMIAKNTKKELRANTTLKCLDRN
jgi:hypothetical protein